MPRLLLAIVLIAAGCDAGSLRPPDVRYEPTPMEVVQAMLELAALRPDDVVADLGCGDGRLVIEALRRGAARGLCVDIDPELIARARDNARAPPGSRTASASSTRTSSAWTTAAPPW